MRSKRDQAFLNRHLRLTVLAPALLATLGAVPAAAQSGPGPAPAPAASPPVVQQLLNCRQIGDPAQRLACFDAQVAALEAAQARREIVIADREAVRETQRGLFGLSLGGLGRLFGGGDGDSAEPEDIQQIESSIREVMVARGGVVMLLENGQRWVFADGLRGRAPRAGQSVVIRRASLGGFLAEIADRAAVRVRREL